MDDMLADQMEWLLSGNLSGIRLNRHLLLMCGCLGSAGIPDEIDQQLRAISRQILLQEVFEALVGSLNQFGKTFQARADSGGQGALWQCPSELAALIGQVEQARTQLAEGEPINHARVIAWIVQQAKERKIWGRQKRR